MSILPIILFLLGVACLLLGWRWQSSPSEEAMTALKGIAYLKKEIIRVHDQLQVHILEDNTKSKEVEPPEFKRRDLKFKGTGIREVRVQEIGFKKIELSKQSEGSGKSKVQRLNPKSRHNASPKYQEVLELAALGYRIPEIAQRLELSQDAIGMILRTRQKGEIL